MDKLPLEIIIIIASFIQDSNLARLSTLSRKWQAAIECRTFARLRISSHGNDINDFALIVTPFRLSSYLRVLKFEVDVLFDESTIEPRSMSQARFSEAFTEALRSLFEVLTEGENADGGVAGNGDGTSGSSGLTLKLGQIDSLRYVRTGRMPYLRERIGVIDGGRPLPMVKCISGFVFEVRAIPRKLALRASIDIASRLPNMKRFELRANYGALIQNPLLHKEDRQALAVALADMQFFKDHQGGEVVFAVDDMHLLKRESYPDCTNESSYDPLGAAFRKWSHNLSSLEIYGVFDESLFGPTEAERRAAPIPIPMPSVLWTRLTKFVATLKPCMPSGGWYFTYGNQTDDTYRGKRNVPCEMTLQPLFASWANAIVGMPTLQQATLRFLIEDPYMEYERRPGTRTDWLVEYQAPSMTLRPTWQKLGESLTSEEHNSCRLVFAGVSGWRPWISTMKKLHEVAKDKYLGREMVELEIGFLEEILWSSSRKNGI